MRKETIFKLYHIGISKSAISRLLKKLDESDVQKILQGNYLEYFAGHNFFSDKDIDILTNSSLISKRLEEADNLLASFAAQQIHILFFYDSQYPQLLKRIPSPPFVLFVKGNVKNLNNDNMISVVGSRKISSVTEKKIKSVTKELVNNKYITVSGLAFGTDILVHRETYKYNGQTVVVLPCSIFNIQPTSHKTDAEKVLANNGNIISEYYTDEEFNRLNYIHRNRIVSGLSKYLIVSECTEKSGTMHTARFAWKQKRKIFCFNNNSSGVKKLLNVPEIEIYSGIQNLKEEMS